MITGNQDRLSIVVWRITNIDNINMITIIKIMKGDLVDQLQSICKYIILPLKYATWLSVQFFWQKSWFILHCLNMSCKGICCQCMNILHLTFNDSLYVLLKCLKWLSQFVINLSSFRLNIGAKKLVIDIEGSVV